MAMIVRKENECPTGPLSWAKINTDESNKLQLQQEIKKCKEAHADIYCWAWKKVTGHDYQTWKSLPSKSHESEFSKHAKFPAKKSDYF